MHPPREERTLEFALHRVTLPEVEGDVRLTLMTLGEGRAFAFWHNPVISAPPGKPGASS